MTISDGLTPAGGHVDGIVAAPVDVVAVQRRTLRLLFAMQVVSGVGVTVGSSVGALLAADIAGTSASGLAQSAAVVGSALLALPASALVQRGGRRPSLAAAYVVAALGSLIIVLAAVRGSIAAMFAGFVTKNSPQDSLVGEANPDANGAALTDWSRARCRCCCRARM